MRKMQMCIISDIHLGTYGSHAKELVAYLNSIDPEILVLNGDIIDMWQFKKRYFPKPHWEVLKCLTSMMMRGVKVYYLTGNHDDALRRFSDMQLGHFELLDKLVLEMDGKTYWMFHGDVFDMSINYSQWIAKLGGKAYDLLIIINRFINKIRAKFNLSPFSFSKKIKSNVKEAVKFIGDFEDTAISLAIENKYDYVICGHIHQAKIKRIKKDDHMVCYMNSGDWVESLTSLEYYEGQWNIYHHLDHNTDAVVEDLVVEYEMELS